MPSQSKHWQYHIVDKVTGQINSIALPTGSIVKAQQLVEKRFNINSLTTMDTGFSVYRSLDTAQRISHDIKTGPYNYDH